MRRCFYLALAVKNKKPIERLNRNACGKLHLLLFKLRIKLLSVRDHIMDAVYDKRRPAVIVTENTVMTEVVV